jgi:hypothetical protein
VESHQILFSPAAKWIWDSTDRWAYHHYIQARTKFTLEPPDSRRISDQGGTTLLITADAYYQAWLNGRVIGEGPAKSAEGRRSVDAWPITSLLSVGSNELLVVALSMGAGSMTYCPGEAGLIFEIDLAGRTISSGKDTEVRADPTRRKRTARRWVLPCIEDVNATTADGEWRPATVVEKHTDLYARRVPLPTREVLPAASLVAADFVRVPNVAITMRLRPYLVEAEEKRRHNTFNTPAYIVTDIVSPTDQALVFTPTLGNVTWYFGGHKLFEGNGWLRWAQSDPPVSIKLRKGSNRLVALHSRNNHFEDISLAGFAEQPVTFSNPFGKGAYQVVRAKSAKDLVEGAAMEHIDWEALKPGMPDMDPEDSMPFGNSYDLACGAQVIERSDQPLERLMRMSTADALELPPVRGGEAVRLTIDLGVVQHGWLAFDVEGNEGSTLILAMFEALDPGPPLRFQWPDGCNNAITYRLRDGYQSFESFFAYGVRYIAIQHSGDKPVLLKNLRVYTANCGSLRRGSMLSDDEMLNAIYRICEQSVISGVDDTFTDCPTYEQVNWNFDNRTATMGDAVTCANYAVTRNSIELFAEDPHYQGLVRSQYPSTWDAQIPLWSFSWIMWCRDYFSNTADRHFVQRIMPRVAAGVEEGLGKIGSRGLLEWAGIQHFVDWGHGRDDDHAIMSAEQAGFAGTLAAAAELGEIAGGELSSSARTWRAAREKLIGAINANLWDANRQAYFDSLHSDGSASKVTSQATNAAMVVYGAASDDTARNLARRIVSNDPQLLLYESPFGVYYVLEMLAKLGEVQALFDLVRERWGAMVLAGDTCTWETFKEFDGRGGGWPTRSRCHPYAAFPAKYFARYLLGVQMLEPGYAKFRVEPRPPKGVEKCYGAVPTPKGPIRVGWEIRNGQIHLNVEHPRGLERV